MTEVMHHSRDVSFDHRSDEHDETKRNSRQYDHMKSGWLHENSETKDVFSDIDHSIPRRPSNHQYIPMKGSSQIQELKKEIDSFSNIEHGQYEHRLIDV